MAPLSTRTINEPVLRARSLTKRYTLNVGPMRRRAEHFTLQPINLDFCRGEHCMVIGHNGSGKSTLLQLLAGLLRPDSGSIVVCGADQPHAWRSSLGYVAQYPVLDPDMTTAETLGLFASLYRLNLRQAKIRIDELFTRFDFQKYRDVPVRKLSGGLKQRAHLMLALVHKPTVLLCDEVEAGLDAATKSTLEQIFNEHCAGGGSVVRVSHDLSRHHHCSRVLMLDQGKVVADDSPQALINNYARARLIIELFDSASQWVAQIERWPEVETCLRDNNKLTIIGTQLKQCQVMAMELFGRAEIGVKRLTFRPPDLDSAYRRLCGHRPSKQASGSWRKSKGSGHRIHD